MTTRRPPSLPRSLPSPWLARATSPVEAEQLTASRREVLRIGLAGLLGLALASRMQRADAGYNIWTGEYTMTRKDIESAVDKRFPTTLNYGQLLTVELTHPQIGFNPQASTVLMIPPPPKAPAKSQADQRVVPVVLAVPMEKTDAYVSATFAPNQANGCGATYDAVVYWRPLARPWRPSNSVPLKMRASSSARTSPCSMAARPPKFS